MLCDALFAIEKQHALRLHKRCHKGFIAYDKFNGMLTMTKHVEQDHVFLLKQFRKETVAHPRSHHDYEPTTKCQ
jgi:hypothetical protein